MSVFLTKTNAIHEESGRRVRTPYGIATVVANCGTVLGRTGLTFALRPEQFPKNARWCILCCASYYHKPNLTKESIDECKLP